MALRSFSKDTLQDNWYEERSSPLQGVIPFDEETNYSTTNEKNFNDPAKLKERNELHKHTNTQPRLIRRDNFDQTVLARPLRDRPEYGFGAVMPTPDINAQNRYLETTNQAAFGTVVKSSTLTLPNEQQVPAGGAGGIRVERGKSASGASGEVIKIHADPQRDSQAQRSWMYSKDPIFTAQRVPTVNDNQIITKPVHYRRQSTNITTVDQKKPGIFTDDSF